MKNRVLNFLYLAVFVSFSYVYLQRHFIDNFNNFEDLELILGEVANLPASWIGTKNVNKNIPILILAGHADSQGLVGAGTAGEAVEKFGLNPMDPKISDELFWNLKL